MTVRAPVGKMNISDQVYCIGRGLCSIKAIGVNPDYLKYFIIKSGEDFNYYSNGTTYDAITISDIKNFYICVPSTPEQVAIVHYLDIKCKAIDEAIERHKEIIKKLEKYKSDNLSYFTLNGLHKIKKIKDSGVEWLENVPKSWKMIRGKYLFEEVSEKSKTGEEELLTVSQYTGITPRSQKNVTMFEAESLVGYKICEAGDIAANTMWLWAGAIGVSDYYGVISPSYNVYRQIDNAYDKDYLDCLLRSKPLVQHYKALSTGIRPSRLRLYPTQFLNIKFPVPPKDEQREIASYLKEVFRRTDEAIKRKDNIISKLEDYRKAVIYNAVTGKIDCRTYSRTKSVNTVDTIQKE